MGSDNADSPKKHSPTIYAREAHSISRDNIDPDALKIMYRLLRHQHKAYLVGGGVRDLLLNKPPKDYDIATDATPRMVKEIFRNSRIIGRRFKLVHVFFGSGKIVQVSTFRDSSEEISAEDEQKDHRLVTDNKYGTEETDAYRRDLTINGLFYDLATFSIIDYVGGMDDLREGIIRIIGNPDVRFKEDPVRMIRVVRHAARSGFMIEPECRASIARNKELLLTCSTMRIFEEVKKDLLSGSCLSIFRLLAQSELLDILLPELTANDLYLLSEKSAFCGALRRADQMVQAKEPLSATPLLALIALFDGYSPTSAADPILRFEGVREIQEHVKGSFKQLAVPRKERERVEDLLAQWYEVKTRGEDARLARMRRSPLHRDLVHFVAMLNYGGAEDANLALVTAPPTKRDEEERDDNHDVENGEFSTHGRRRPRRRRVRSKRPTPISSPW